MDNAKDWISWSSSGWHQGTHFSFAVLDDFGDVAAACDIKSAEPDGAEIGYWSSSHHRGTMTSAVQLMCQEAKRAGFRVLTARVLPDNVKSKAVLNRVGFCEIPLAQPSSHHHFTLDLRFLHGPSLGC